MKVYLKYLATCFLLILFVGKGLGQCYTVGYLGNNLWNPGIFTAVSAEREKFSLESQIGFFVDPHTLSAISLNLGAAKRFGKWQLSLYPIGIQRSFRKNTYRFDEDGLVTGPSSLRGRFFYNPTFSLGRVFGEQDKVKIKLQLQALTPYHSSFLPQLQFLVGYKIHER